MLRAQDSVKSTVLSGYPEMLTVGHICKYLHVGKKSVYGMMRRGELKYVKVGKNHITSKKWLKECLDGSADYDTIKIVSEDASAGKEILS